MIQITLRHKIYLALVAAGLLIAAWAIGEVGFRLGTSRIERRAAELEQVSQRHESAAREAIKTSELHAARAEALEQQIREIRDLAQRQNDELKTLAAATGTARNRVERARDIRSIETTTAELCAKLAALGHECRP